MPTDTQHDLIPAEQPTLPATRSASELIPVEEMRATRELGTTVAMFRTALNEAADDVEKAIYTARGIQTISSMLTPLLPMIKQLMGSPLGFQTDRDKDVAEGKTQAYPDRVIRDCVCSALLQGAQLSGKQFAILAGNTYITQRGMEAAVLGWPGLAEWDSECEIQETRGDVARVSAVAKWSLDGRPSAIRYDGNERPLIPVRVNRGMMEEAVLGKAKRKLYAKVLEKLTGGVVMTISDDGEADEPMVTDKAVIRTGSAMERTVRPEGSINEFFSLDELNACRTAKDVNAYQRECVQNVAADNPANAAQIREAIQAACDSKRRDLRDSKA